MNHRASLRASRWLAVVLVVLHAGCGGDGESPPAALGMCGEPGAVPGPYVVVVKPGAAVGRTAAATIAACGQGRIESPQWTQTAGPAVTLLAGKTQTISFDPPAPGLYGFRVAFRLASDASGSGTRNSDVVVEVAPAGTTQLALRASQSVRMGGAVSLRAWPQPTPGDAVQTITWEQTGGPAVTLDTRDSYVAHFTAPAVQSDSLIGVRATLTTRNGQTASDEAWVLVEPHPQAAASDAGALWAGDHVSRVHPYRAAGPYAGVLARCVYDSGLRTENLCPLSQLPFLAQETGGAVPTIDQVMDRVVVSHDWAGRNFETFLRDHDPRGDIRRMLLSVTAVVIGTQVRPSFYYAVTGAIYLDADNFWLTPEERDTVNEAPDYRSGFGSTLQYTTLWRYVRGSTSLFQFFDPRQRVTRGTAALRDEAGWLLLHELGHALDFLPPASYAALVSASSPWANIAPRYQAGQLTSDIVTSNHPLTSSEMAGLGQVRFFGSTASTTQVAYTPAQVAGFFAADRATDDYAYASRREDVAMSLEEFLMQLWLGVKRDFAIVPRPGTGATGATLVVQWGQRGRVGEPALRPRLRAVVQQLVPWVDPAEVDRLPAPILMRAGDSWTGNLVLPGPPSPSPRLEKTEPTLQELWLLEQAQRRRLRLQPHARPLPQAAPTR